jgi:hypothetical protein
MPAENFLIRLARSHQQSQVKWHLPSQDKYHQTSLLPRWTRNCLLNRERLYSVQANALESYLEHFLQPRFWLGTKFFVWFTNMYGIEIIMIFRFFHQ